LTSGDTGSDPIYAARNLLLTGSPYWADPVDALLHRIEIERRYVGPLLIGRGAACAAVRSCRDAACNSCGWRRQTAKLRIELAILSLRCIAIRLPAKVQGHQCRNIIRKTDEGEQDSLAERRPRLRTVFFLVDRAKQQCLPSQDLVHTRAVSKCLT